MKFQKNKLQLNTLYISIFSLTHPRILNGIGNIYGHGLGATGGRSIRSEDIDQYFKYDKTTYTEGDYTYGDTQEYTSGQFIVNDEIVQAPQTMTLTSYSYRFVDYKYEESENVEANEAYKMLCEDMDTVPQWFGGTGSPYWIATRSVYLSGDDRCNFEIVYSGNGRYGHVTLFYSKEELNDSLSYFSILPVVTLQTGITGSKDQNGVWNLDV